MLIQCTDCSKILVANDEKAKKILSGDIKKIKCKSCSNVFEILNIQSVFVSYSHKDENWKDELGKYLQYYEQNNSFKIWTDRELKAGDNWKTLINNAIDQSSVAILLISIDFLNSKFIRNQEVPRILERHKSGKMTIIPVIVKNCPWKKEKWINDLQARPLDGKTLIDFNEKEIDTCLMNIADEVSDIFIEKNKDEIIDDLPEKNFGPEVHRMCNREKQFNMFRKCFTKHINNINPQIYFIHGFEGDAHASFVRRLQSTLIRTYVKKNLGQKAKPFLLENVIWPEDGDLDDLLWSLMRGVDQEFFGSDFSLSNLVNMNAIEKYKNNVVIISHRIPEARWKPNLFQSYIDKFWLQCQKINEMPQFLLFFNILYSRNKVGIFQKRLNLFQKFLIHKQYNCKIIEKLNPVTKDNVSNWFIRYKIENEEYKRKEKVEIIFKEKGELSMSEVEKELKKYAK